jgi:DNA-binding GntR family transcriptional regulator
MTKLNAQVYRSLRHALICGRWTPGHAVSLRSLAAELDVSPMPIRDAISRLVAECAVELRDRRIFVPTMSEARLHDLIDLRIAIEPGLARRALAAVTPSHIEKLSHLNALNNASIRNGDTEGYILTNYRFHRALYSLSGSAVLIPVLDQVWLQLGPFSRLVYGRLGTAQLDDKHLRAIAALEARDGQALADAITADIEDGRKLLLTEPIPAANEGAAHLQEQDGEDGPPPAFFLDAM